MGARHAIAAIVVAAVAATAAAGAGASAATVSCPAAASTAPAASATAVVWEFSELGPPAPAGPASTTSWTRGAGVWSGGRAKGAICSNDGSGATGRDIVLSVSGASRLSPKITKLGLPGVGLALPVAVSASNDPACPAGATGTVTLFASYYGVHRDTIVAHFAPACADHDHTFTGSIVHVLIARDGHQVNSAA